MPTEPGMTEYPWPMPRPEVHCVMPEGLDDAPPTAEIPTGFSDSDLASSLKVWHLNGSTYVRSVDDFQGGSDWRFDGTLPPAIVLAEYLISDWQASDQNLDWPHCPIAP